MPNFQGHQSLPKHTGASPSDWYPFRCGHCGFSASGVVVSSFPSTSTVFVRWLLCPRCEKGSVWNLNVGAFEGYVSPPALHGDNLEGLPPAVAAGYAEARRCMGVSAYSATELLCRRLLMHVAADKGADEGKSFVEYLGYLGDHGYITPPMRPWVDLIREHGNKATHRLDPPDEKRAQATFLFTEELLRLVYEMDHHAKEYLPTVE